MTPRTAARTEVLGAGKALEAIRPTNVTIWLRNGGSVTMSERP